MGQHTLVFLLLISLLNKVLATPCIAFDANFNLFAFGLDGKDWNATTQATWSSTTGASDITTSGRPPFNGPTPTCYLSQFENAIYVLGADTANPSSVYIYDASAKSWSAQSVTAGSFDPNSFNAILDHDTNVFYALSKGELFFLDMGELKAANSSALSWVDVEKAGFNTDNYQPVLALAQNHIHFLNVPGVPAGDADIFVIHFSYFQPEPQAYPLADGSTFPATHGQATSFFQTSGVQQEFAFIPDDGSATYVINVETNTTAALAGPKIIDSAATYFAGITSLVQLDSKGVVSFLPYQQNATAVNKAASWSTVASLASVAPASSSGNNTTASSTTASATKTGTSASSATSGANGHSASLGKRIDIDLCLSFALVLGLTAVLLS
jgi:hypothetical protein